MSDNATPEPPNGGDDDANGLRHKWSAKDISGVGGIIFRNLVSNGCGEILRREYGLSLDEAHLSVQCAKLASISHWDVDTMIAAATVHEAHQINLINAERARKPDRALHAAEVAQEAHILDEIELTTINVRSAIARSNQLLPLHSADAVLLLESAHVWLFHELREAVAACVFSGADDIQAANRCRALAGMQPLSVDDEMRLYGDGPSHNFGALAHAAPAAGISKDAAIEAFGSLLSTSLKSALEDAPKWIVHARLKKGTPGNTHAAVWCPVLLAVCLYESKHVPKPKLNKVFHDHDFLNDWRDRWTEVSRSLVRNTGL